MSDIGGLTVSAVLPVVVSALLYVWAKQPGSFLRKLKVPVQQAIFGLVFGAIAVLATVLGADLDGAILNVRIAAPMTAALIFGGPAGIIAGIIGGVARYIAGMMGIGTYTQLACSLATVLAGFLGALFRKYVQDDKPPAWYYGLLAGAFAEVIDMLLILLLHMADIEGAFLFVRACALPMILLNSASITVSVIVADRIARRKTNRTELPQLAQLYQRWLALLMVAGFVGTSVFTYFLQTKLCEENAQTLLRTNLMDVREDVRDDTQFTLVDMARWVESNLYSTLPTDMTVYLSVLARRQGIAEIDLVDKHGVITASNVPDVTGFDLASNEDTAVFMDLLHGSSEVVRQLGPGILDDGGLRAYAGVPRDEGFLLVGIDQETYEDEVLWQLRDRTANTHIGESGHILIAGQDGALLSQPAEYDAQMLREVVPFSGDYPADGKIFKADVYGEQSFCIYGSGEGYQFVATLPVAEAYAQRDLTSFVTIFMEVVLFACLFLAVLLLTKHLVVRNIDEINADLEQITEGNLDVTVDVRATSEFGTLSDDINETVTTLKRYIAEAEDRMRAELELARSIQMSSLQSVFPPFPQHDEFSLFALMRTAKEVGGDFYDFYLLDDDHLALVIADVSGKGVPAALFMMTAKTLIKDLAESGLSVGEIFTRANNELCANNEEGMFVTAWMGILDLRTGRIEFANAGHTPPIRSDEAGHFHEVKTRAGLVLGGMEGLTYRQGEMHMKAGESLFLYTDGVTEAIDKDENMFEVPRLLETLDANPEASPEDLCDSVLGAVDGFVGEAPQFDDITMVCLRLLKEQHMREVEVEVEVEVEAKTANLEKINALAEQVFEEAGVGPKESGQLSVAIDEIFSNIANYSGANAVTVAVMEADGRIIIRFVDDGIPYDPSSAKEPDITLPASEREIGGLGIHLVRKLMDEVRYEHKNGCNILVIEKQYKRA